MSGATVSINNGFYTQTTNAAGQYNFASVVAGTWQVTASANGHSSTVAVTVNNSGVTTQDFVLR